MDFIALPFPAQNLQDIYDVLKWVFTIFPQFCLGQGLIELCYNQIQYDLTHSFGVDPYVSPFEMSFLGWIFVQLALQGSVLLLLRVLLHWDLVRSCRWVLERLRLLNEEERPPSWRLQETCLLGAHSSDELGFVLLSLFSVLDGMRHGHEGECQKIRRRPVR